MAKRSHFLLPVVLVGLLVVVAFALMACQAAPTATPTVPPTATKAAAPAPATAAPPAAAATPTGAAPAAAATATKAPVTPAAAPKAQAKGKLVIAGETEPDTLEPRDGSFAGTKQILVNTTETLTGRDGKTMQVIPVLAESYQKVDDKTWRFKLRKGVKFQDGTDFKADAVVQAAGRFIGLQGTLWRYVNTMTQVKAVDDYTVDVITAATDPILPDRMYFMYLSSPTWVKDHPEELPSKSIGTGPYKFVEWSKGQYVKMAANENYWGKAPTIAEVVFLARKENAVRAAMVKTGEAQIAWNIPAEEASKVPVALRQKTVEVLGVKMNVKYNPVLKDERVRQAVNLAMDREGISKALYTGFASPATHLVNPSATGFNADLKPYVFDVNKAKQLIAEAKAAGVPTDTQLNLYHRTGWWQKDGEMAEAIVSQLNAVGLKVKQNPLDSVAWQTLQWAVKPEETHPDFHMVSHGNELMDSSGTFDNYYACDGRGSLVCFPEFDKLATEAKALSGADRVKKFAEAWKFAYDRQMFVPLMSIDFVHGVTKNVEWLPRQDGFIFVNEIKLN